jgi:hypothetical protein
MCRTPKICVCYTATSVSYLSPTRRDEPHNKQKRKRTTHSRVKLAAKSKPQISAVAESTAITSGIPCSPFGSFLKKCLELDSMYRQEDLIVKRSMVGPGSYWFCG